MIHMVLQRFFTNQWFCIEPQTLKEPLESISSSLHAFLQLRSVLYGSLKNLLKMDVNTNIKALLQLQVKEPFWYSIEPFACKPKVAEVATLSIQMIFNGSEAMAIVLC